MVNRQVSDKRKNTLETIQTQFINKKQNTC